MEAKLNLANKIEELDKVAEFVEQLGEMLELDMVMVMNLNLALEEAISNIINYGYTDESDGEIVINFSSQASSLQFSIVDNGKKFDPTQVSEADITLSAEERKIGGLGIFLINKLMDEVSYNRIGCTNQLTLIKWLPLGRPLKR